MTKLSFTFANISIIPRSSSLHQTHVLIYIPASFLHFNFLSLSVCVCLFVYVCQSCYLLLLNFFVSTYLSEQQQNSGLGEDTAKRNFLTMIKLFSASFFSSGFIFVTENKQTAPNYTFKLLVCDKLTRERASKRNKLKFARTPEKFTESHTSTWKWIFFHHLCCVTTGKMFYTILVSWSKFVKSNISRTKFSHLVIKSFLIELLKLFFVEIIVSA